MASQGWVGEQLTSHQKNYNIQTQVIQHNFESRLRRLVSDPNSARLDQKMLAMALPDYISLVFHTRQNGDLEKLPEL